MSCLSPDSIASPIAVRPSACQPARARAAAAWSVVGGDSTVGFWLNTITPTATSFGTVARKRCAARSAATRREGDTSVAAIELELSASSMIEALWIGTARVACGPASATISTASATANASIGR